MGIEKIPIAVTIENESLITFYYQVNECEEFPTMGETHSMISTATEAFDIYKSIPTVRKSLVAGISVVGVDAAGNELEVIPVSNGNTIDLSLLEYSPNAKKNPIANKMIKEIVDISRKSGFKTYGNFKFGNDLERENIRHRAGR